MSNEWEPGNIYEVLSDERVRQILVATNDRKRSAQSIAERCDGSLSSIYRRLDILTEYGLLEKDIRINENGHHHSVFEPDFEVIRFRIDDLETKVIVDYGEETESFTEQWPALDR